MSCNITRNKILAAAIELFSTQGYCDTTIREIAHLSGIKSASLYNHFKSKDEILDNILEMYQDLVTKHTTASCEIEIAGELATMEEITGHLFFQFPDDVADTYSKISMIIHHEQMCNVKVKAFMEKMISSKYDLIKSVLQNLIERKAIPMCNSTKVAATLYSIIHSFWSLSTINRNEFDVSDKDTGMFPLVEFVISAVIEGRM